MRGRRTLPAFLCDWTVALLDAAVWFAGGTEVDRELAERFEDVLERARRGELDHRVDTPRGWLALIVVLDQFSRNVYRDTPFAYARTRRP